MCRFVWALLLAVAPLAAQETPPRELRAFRATDLVELTIFDATIGPSAMLMTIPRIGADNIAITTQPNCGSGSTVRLRG